MKIAIDAHMVGERETGNETYVLNLVRALLALPEEARERLEFVLYTTHPERLRPRLDPLHPAAIRHVCPAPAPLRIPFGLPVATALDGAALLHVSYVAPPLGICPHVVTVHDISYELYPEFFSPRDRLVLRTWVPLTIRRAARIITVSQDSRQQIIRRYRVSPGRVVVTYEAAAEQYHPVVDPDLLAGVRARYGLGEQYLLALGNLQPRKNLGMLVDAYVRLRGQGYLQGTQLIIAGQAQWRESELFAKVRQSGLEGDIRFPGYISDEDLPAVYSGALAFVFPSVYEGFGLPPLEAMACGTPVISSKAASLPEVVGDAALTFDPRDLDALVAALLRFLSLPDLRHELREKGLHRAGQFSWRRCAEETLTVYRSALAGG